MMPGNRQHAAGNGKKRGSHRFLRALSRSLPALSLIASLAEPPRIQAGEAPLAIEDDLDRGSLRLAIERSLEFLAKLPGNQTVGERPKRLTAREAKDSFHGFVALLDLWQRPQQFAEAVRSRFDFVPSISDASRSELLVTGYYEPVLDGSLNLTSVYRFPIYRKPDDLVGMTPRLSGENNGGAYLSRREIDVLGQLRGRGYEIAWVKDPVDLFFLHVQGSGAIRLEDGRTVRVNYTANNGRSYTSIGKILIDEGKIAAEELTAASLRRYLVEHAAERDALLARNERYVFFRFAEGGPFGSLGVPVTPGRSVATDPGYFPRGALGFLASRMPLIGTDGSLAGWRPFSRFVVSQDTGGAIRGPGRVDLFFGSGEEAGGPAGYMKSGGKFYLLARKNAGGK